MSYWIFKCNPERFRIDARLRDPAPQTAWTVSRYRDEIAPGDIAFIWRTGPGGGIVAVLRVESDPEVMPDGKPDDRLWIDPRDADPTWRVRGRFTHRIACLTREELSMVKGLEALSVFHGWQQATQFRVTPAEGDILMRLVENAGAQGARGITRWGAQPGNMGSGHK
jgi:predicted RNA-binding protein with PUA-like domain